MRGGAARRIPADEVKYVQEGKIMKILFENACVLTPDGKHLPAASVAVENETITAIGEITAAAALAILTCRAFPALYKDISVRRTAGLAISSLFSAVIMLLFRQILEKFLQKALPLQNLVIITIVFLMGLVVYLLCIRIFKAADFSANE